MLKQDDHSFLVVGGGIVGLSIALALQQSGVCSVSIVEKETIGSGASWGNAGHLATEQVFPIADSRLIKHIPRMLCDPLGPLRVDWRHLMTLFPWLLNVLKQMQPRRAQAVHHALLCLNAHALSAWQTFAKAWHVTPWMSLHGSLLVAEKAASVARLQKHGAYLNEKAVENQWLNQKQLLELEPSLATSQLGGVFFPKTGYIFDLEKMINTLKREFIALGGKVLEHHCVDTIEKISDQAVRLQTNLGQLTARNLVIAAGAFSVPFVQQLTGIHVPLEPERGYHLMLPHEVGRFSIPISSADRQFIMTPMHRGLRLAGTVEYAGFRLPPNMQRAQNFVPLANPMLKIPLQTEGAAPWMGFRPSLSDSLPVIDRQANCYFAFGHHHLGLTQAPITAEMIRALHFDAPLPMDIRAFKITRFE